MFLQNIINYFSIKTAQLESTTTTLFKLKIPLKHLIKEGNLRKMNIEIEDVLKYGDEFADKTKNLFLAKIPQSFIKTTLISPTSQLEEFNFEHPFFLIPLYKIKDFENNNIHYSLFEEELNNNIFYSNSYLAKISLRRNIIPFISSIVLNYKNETVFNLINDKNQSDKNGYLILKDHNSDCAMVYASILIDTLNLNDLTNPLRQLIDYSLFNKTTNEIKAEDISIKIELNIIDLKKGINLKFFNKENGLSGDYILKLNSLLETIPSDMTIELKGEKQDDEVVFSITNSLYKKEEDTFFRIEKATTVNPNISLNNNIETIEEYTTEGINNNNNTENIPKEVVELGKTTVSLAEKCANIITKVIESPNSQEAVNNINNDITPLVKDCENFANSLKRSLPVISRKLENVFEELEKEIENPERNGDDNCVIS